MPSSDLTHLIAQIPVLEFPGEATLYIVATPLGNLHDISLRALQILAGVDLILCEDTRKTSHLTARFGITTRRKSYRVHRLDEDNAFALQQLQSGHHLALVSDAGTPGVSDPGSHLVRYIRKNRPETPIIPLPGPSAITAALSISGWQSNPCIFLGFLPPKSGKRHRDLLKWQQFEGVVVLYESVHRIEKLLRDARPIFEKREILVLRELTKIHEQHIMFPAEISDVEFEERMHTMTQKGEFTVLIGPKK